MVTPDQRRLAACHLAKQHEVSERRACRLIGLGRSTMRYRCRRPEEPKLRQRLRELAAKRRRFGYRRLGVLLRREAFAVNHKRLYRITAKRARRSSSRPPRQACR